MGIEDTNPLEPKARKIYAVSLESGTDTAVKKLNELWHKIGVENGFETEPSTDNFKDKTINLISYSSIELGKNIVEYGEGGKLTIWVEEDKITVITLDS